MAKASQSKPEAAKTIFGIGFLRAPDGTVVVVRGLMPLDACERISPSRVDAVMTTKPMPHKTEPDNQGRVFTVVRPTAVKTGERPVYGEKSSVSASRGVEALGVLLNRAIHGAPESLAAIAAIPEKAKPKKRPAPQPTKRDQHVAAERALDLLGKPDVEVARVLRKAGRSEEQIAKYLRERAA